MGKQKGRSPKTHIPVKIRNAIRTTVNSKVANNTKPGATVMVTVQTDTSSKPIEVSMESFFADMKKKFPLAVESLKGNFINFESMAFEQVVERCTVFFRTMEIAFDEPLGKKEEQRIAALQDLLVPALERAEADLAELAWPHA